MLRRWTGRSKSRSRRRKKRSRWRRRRRSVRNRGRENAFRATKVRAEIQYRGDRGFIGCEVARARRNRVLVNRRARLHRKQQRGEFAAAKTHRAKRKRPLRDRYAADREAQRDAPRRCSSPSVMEGGVTCRGSLVLPNLFRSTRVAAATSVSAPPRAPSAPGRRKNRADSFIEHRLSNSVRKTLTARSGEALSILPKEICLAVARRRGRGHDGGGGREIAGKQSEEMMMMMLLSALPARPTASS